MCYFDSEVMLKAFNEMLTRLPLSLITANDRLQNSNQNNQIQLVYDYSIASCNVVFNTLIKNYSSIKTSQNFKSPWLRFLSILSTNGNMLIRGTNIHNEILDIIAALLKCLKIPKQSTSSVRGPQSQLGDSSVNTAKVSPEQEKIRGSEASAGWLTWWTGQSLPKSSPSSDDRANEELVEVEVPRDTRECVKAEIDEGEEEEDSELLAVSWKTVCSLYTSFPSHLRIKYPQLVSDIAQFVDSRDRLASMPAKEDSSNEQKSFQKHEKPLESRENKKAQVV
jgi:hypothetical protein